LRRIANSPIYLSFRYRLFGISAFGATPNPNNIANRLSMAAGIPHRQNGDHALLDKPTLKARAAKATVSDIPAGQTKPSLQRFLLKVDGQTKTTFPTLEAAEKAGLTIKKAYPIVRVSVYDSVVGGQTII
jgi:hypothetical protein